MLCQSVGTMAGPLCLGMHRHVYWLWLALRQYQGILDHSGYEGLPLWLDPFSYMAADLRVRGTCILPAVLGGTQFHDAHHQHFDCNYASCFSVIDSIMGTHYDSMVERRREDRVKKCSDG